MVKVITIFEPYGERSVSGSMEESDALAVMDINLESDYVRRVEMETV